MQKAAKKKRITPIEVPTTVQEPEECAPMAMQIGHQPIEQQQQVDLYEFDENQGDFINNPVLLMKVDLSDISDGFLSWREQLKRRNVNLNEAYGDKAGSRSGHLLRTLQRLDNQNMELSEVDELQGDDSEAIVDGTDDNGEEETQKPKRRKDDEYDYNDPWFDDSSVVQYLSREKLKTKHTGFFVNQGAVETVAEQSAQGGKQKKTGNKTTRKKAVDDDGQTEPAAFKSTKWKAIDDDAPTDGGSKVTKKKTQVGNDNQTETAIRKNVEKDKEKDKQESSKKIIEREKEREGGVGRSVVEMALSALFQTGEKDKEKEIQQRKSVGSEEEETMIRPNSADSYQQNDESLDQGGKDGQTNSREARGSKKQSKEFEIPEDLQGYIKEIKKLAIELPVPDPNKKFFRCPEALSKELLNFAPVYYSSCGNSIKAKDKVVSELMKYLEPWFKDKQKLKGKLSELQRRDGKDGKDESLLDSMKNDLQNLIHSKQELLAKQSEPWDEQVVEKVQRYVDVVLKIGKQVDWNMLVSVWAQENMSVDIKMLQSKIKFQAVKQTED